MNHDDRTTILNGEWSQLLAHFLLEDFYSLHEVRILLTQTDILLLEEPPRQTAHFPFCTNVWTRANDDIHAVLLSEAAESCHIVIASEVEFAFLLLMDIPEHIEADGIHAKSLAHLDAMLPVGTRNTRVVQLGSLNHERFAIEKECLVAGSEGATFLCRHHLSRCQCQ